MNKEDRDMLLSEIRKFDIIYSEDYDEDDVIPLLLNVNLSNSSKENYPLFGRLQDEKYAKKILMKNKYGIVSNLLYKYRNNLDIELLLEMTIKDIVLFYPNKFSKFKEILKYIPKDIKIELLNNKYWVLRLINYYREDRGYFDFISEYEFTEIRDILSNVSSTLLSDREFMKEAIMYSSYCLLSANNDLKNDKELIMDAIINNHGYIEYVNNDLKNDKEFMKEAIKIDCNALKYIGLELRKDIDYLIDIISNSNCKYLVISNIVSFLDKNSLKILKNNFKNNKTIIDLIDNAVIFVTHKKKIEDALPF